MFVNRLEIKGFGKISGLTIELINGFNIIFGKNEAGKSTIQWFIRGMLYGLKGGRASKDGTPPPLKKFRPWNSDNYGGIIEYTLDNGQMFRVERNFESNSVKVFDALYNEITQSFNISKEKGALFAEHHLGLNEESFDRTVFIKQMESKIDNDGCKELYNRLLNITQTGFYDTSFKKAETALREALKKHVGTERTSKSPLDMIEKRLEELKNIRKDLVEKKNSLFEIEAKLAGYVKEKEKLENIKRLLSKVQLLYEIRGELEKCLKQHSELVAIQSEVKRIEDELKDALQQLEDRISAARRRKKGLGYLAAGLIITSFASTMAGALWDKTAYISAALMLFAALVVIIARGRISRELSAMIMQKRKKAEGVKAPVLSDTCHVNVEHLDKLINKAAEEERELERRLESCISDIDGIFDSVDFTGYQLKIFDDNLMNSNLDELKYNLKLDSDTIENLYSNVLLNIRECETMLNSISYDEESFQKTEEELEELENKKSFLEDTYASLNIALDVLTEASLEIRRDIGPRLNSRMSGIISRITGGRYNDLRADDKLRLNAVNPDSGDVTASLVLSGGTVDQMYLALRIAAAEIITAGQETVPLFLDEALSQYDDDRSRETLEFLDEMATKRQVVLFTCKKREVDMALEIAGDKLNLVNI
ncbi:MAG TPA: AAA family ATPase [Clostridiaceae bacterium]|nr:AAA family ATPase [Clostridiaceae bacterium]